jgi:hypothetical protein
MQGAAYLRSQAELCLQMAHLMSDRRVAEGLQIKAAQYFARAMAIEARVGAAGPTSSTKP